MEPPRNVIEKIAFCIICPLQLGKLKYCITVPKHRFYSLISLSLALASSVSMSS